MKAESSSIRLDSEIVTSTETSYNNAARQHKPWAFSILEPIYRNAAKLLVRCVYRTEFIGFDNIPPTGPAVLISNHVSYVDGLIINAASKRPIRFVVDARIYRLPIVHYFMTLNRAIPIEPSRESVKHMLDEVGKAMRAGELVCIFPEGKLTYTGNMSRFRPGIEWIISRNAVPVVPILLLGLWGSIFSRKYRGKQYRFVPKDLFRKITAICGKPIPPEKAKVTLIQRHIMEMQNQTNNN